MSEHARLGPSNTRWPHCPGSIREEAAYPDTISVPAIDGTGSHLLLELALTEEGVTNVMSFIGDTIGADHNEGPWLVDEKRATRVQVAVDYIESRMDELGPDTILKTEIRTDPGAKYGRDDWWGTVDVTLTCGPIVEVIDYKDGYVFVSEHTSQLVGYSVGQTTDETETVIKTIIQPKNENNPIRSVTHSIEENNALGQKLADAAALTDDPEAILIAGNHCKWCNHKGNCAARNVIAVKAINGSRNPADMTPEQIAEVTDAIPMIESFLEAVEKEAIARIGNGMNIPGYDMVAGRAPNPKWIDEEVALKKLQGMRFKLEQRSNNKIITPTNALKLDLTEKQRLNVEKLIERPPAAKKLKKVFKKTVEQMFKPKELTPKYMMTSAAEYTRQEYLDSGWTDVQLINNKMMEIR